VQQCDANAIHDCLLTLCWLDGILAKTCLVDPVDRYLMFGYEIAAEIALAKTSPNQREPRQIGPSNEGPLFLT